MSIYALSHTCGIIMYNVYVSADCSIEEGNSAILFAFNYVEKGMHFCKAKQVEKGKTINKIKLLKPIQVLTGW